MWWSPATNNWKLWPSHNAQCIQEWPLPLCGHRWLENLPAVERAIDIWPYIVTYVDQVKAKKLPDPGSSSYDTIAEAWMDHIILAKLHFFMCISRSFQLVPDRYPDDSFPQQRFGGSNQGRPNDY